MHGVKRVIVFCLLIVILPSILISIPLYLRKILFADVEYKVAESDIIEIRDGISSIFCEKHSLRMNSQFNAFQLKHRPKVSTHHKHIRLKKSMTLPDDTLEYWGFYLLKGAIVNLKCCSRYDGSRILIVKGEKNLNTCGLLDHNKDKYGANYAAGHDKVSVFFEETVQLEPSPSPALTESDNNTKIHKARKSKHEKDNLIIQEMENHAGEVEDDETDASLNRDNVDDRYVKYKRKHSKKKENKTDIENNNSSDKKMNKREALYNRLYNKNPVKRQKRDHLYDRKYSHGGNALNYTEKDESTSISSFENGLMECYDGQILSAKYFHPSTECSIDFLNIENGTQRMRGEHEVIADGYYYYIFYSDNDLVKNDMHVIFDIYKPTFQYMNLSDSQGCINSTNCTFPIHFMSDEIVVVEVPTRDGIEHEEDDFTYLYSTCHPRMYVYAVFPISVLILILGCAFL